jgi:hypothetical protein
MLSNGHINPDRWARSGKEVRKCLFFVEKNKIIRKILKSIDNNTIKYYNVFKDKENKYRMKGIR